MINKQKITSDNNLDESAVIGYFEGKCGDGDVVNENGLLIDREVWKNIFDSDEYKSHLANGYYIGFLGHPEDPGCQEFEHACIILRECHIDDNGDVIGRCDLVNTPVGRIVKTFIDAGVNFGLSVRGAGDIISDSVDPDTFIFRGFDVVAFPAYKDAIPKFTEIAASTNLDDQLKYKKICACIDKEIPNISDVNSLEVIQSQFSENSDIHKEVQDRIDTIQNEVEDTCSIEDEKFEGLMALYLKSLETIRSLSEQLAASNELCHDNERKLTASTNIYNSQMHLIKDKYSVLEYESVKLDDKCKELIAANTQLKITNKNLKKDLKTIQASHQALSNKSTQDEDEISEAKEKIKSLEKNNLNYKQKITSSNKALEKKDSIIASLRSQLNETIDQKTYKKQISNRDTEISEMKSDIKAALDLVKEYQDAYAGLYASIVGISLDNVTVNTLTSVSELRDIIEGSTSTSGIAVQPSFTDIEESVEDDVDDIIDDTEDLITM